MRGRFAVSARWALAAYAVFLASILLGPSAAVPTASVSLFGRLMYAVGFSPTLANPDRVEFAANVLIIAPVGLLGSLSWPRLNWRDWTTTGFVLAGLVELCQALFLSGRSASFVDVVANTLGALGGSLIYWLCLVQHGRTWSKSSPTRAGKGRWTL